MGRWVIALLAAGTVLVGASAFAESEPVVLAPTAFASHGIPAGTTTTFAAACRPGYVATSAGVSRPAPGTTLLAITPLGPRAFRFRFDNPAANGDRRVTVAVACRKLLPAGAPRYSLKLNRLRPKLVVVAPRRTMSAALACPPGTTPAGAGVDLGGDRLSIRRQTSTVGRLSFSVLNAGPRKRTVALHGGCVTLVRRPGAASERLHVEVTTFRVVVHRGRQTFARGCPHGWFSLAPGYALLSRATQLDGAVALGTGGRWTVTNGANVEARADLELVCGRVAP